MKVTKINKLAASKLGKTWQEKLSNLPESGMGYQIVDITLKDGRVLGKVPVLNGEYCQTDVVFSSDDVKNVRLSF